MTTTYDPFGGSQLTMTIYTASGNSYVRGKLVTATFADAVYYK